MKKFFFGLFFSAMICAAASVGASAKNQSGEVQTQKFVLDNGLTVLISEMPLSSTVSIFGLVKTGSATEGKYTATGISHFLEHMLFKGTDKRGVGQISKEVQSLGGEINASTSFDYTIYTLTLPKSAFDQGLDIISDMLTHSKFDPQQIQKEREVVYGEMRLYKDNPDRYLSEMVFNTVYKQHPYGIPVIGYEDLLRTLTRDDFVDYYKTHYTPNNIVLAIAGNVRAEQILPKVREIFKDFARKPTVIRNLAPEPPQINLRSAIEEYPTDLTRISMAYSGVSLRDPDLYAMDVLAMILGQGESSRLFKEVFLNKKLVRSIVSTNFTPMDRGIFEIQMLLDQTHSDAAIESVKEQIALIAQNGVQPFELDKIKHQVISQHIFSRLTSDGVADTTACDEAFIGDYDFSKKYIEAVKRITSDDIKTVAKKYFIDDKLSLVILNPKKQKQLATEKPSVNPSVEIKKIVLDNGLTVLLRENHSAPIVSINLVVNGGTAQENVDNNGVSHLTAQLLTAGTKSRSQEDIAQSVESRGASLNSFSGRNSFGLMFNLLSEDTNFGIDLLADIIKNSTFPEQEIARQKQDLMTALISQDDNIRVVASRHLRELLFLTHPFRLDSLGTRASVEKISRKDVEDFYKKYVVPNNMVLSVFGDIDSVGILESLKNNFGNLKKTDVRILSFKENPPAQKREKIIELNKNQAMVLIGFQGVDAKSKDRYATEVLSSILGSAFSGRIFTTIRDEFGQAYTLGGGFTPSRDIGMISFFVQTTNESVEKVRGVLTKLIGEIQKTPVGTQELADMKTYLKGSFAMNLQTDSSLGFICALDELNGNGYNYYQSYDRQIDAVTADDVKRLANQYLDFNKAAVVIARPSQEALKTPVVKPAVNKQAGPSDIH